MKNCIALAKEKTVFMIVYIEINNYASNGQNKSSNEKTIIS